MSTTALKYFIPHYTVKQRGKRTYIHALIWANFSLRESSPELATSSLEFEYLHRKSRCEMLIGRDDISYDVITLGTCFQRLFKFAFVSASRWLTEIWQLNRRGATGELEGEFKFRRRSYKLPFIFPPRRQSTSESDTNKQEKWHWHETKKFMYLK